MRPSRWLPLLAATLLVAAPAFAQTRTPWRMHDGLEVTNDNPLGLVPFDCEPAKHGDVCEYFDAHVPPGADAGWHAAPDGEVIGYDVPSRVCQAPTTCFAFGDFTYFETLVNVPPTPAVTAFAVIFGGMDDGCRVTIFNSAYPAGIVVPGSYVFPGGTTTANLKDYVVAGEVNRVVVTQVDDCCAENTPLLANVVLNGSPVFTNQPPVCDAGGPYTAGATGRVTLDASGSSDADADALTFEWSANCAGATFDDAHSAHAVLTVPPQGQAIDCAVTLVVRDGQSASTCTAPVHVPAGGNRPPDCSAAALSRTSLWPPDHTLRGVTISGVTDPDGDAVTVTVAGVTQDEPLDGLGDGDTAPDAVIADGQLSLRAERSGRGNGRVYVVHFTASDGRGGSCEGALTVCVPHDMGHAECVDDGQDVDATGGPGGDDAARGGPALRVRPSGPFAAEVRYTVAAAGPVDLAVYDLVGRRVAVVTDGVRASGSYTQVVSLDGLPRGLYFVRLRAGGTLLTGRVLKLR